MTDHTAITCEPRCACGDPTLCGTRDAYVYAWGNNERRAALKGRPCVVLARGRMRTVLIQMVDTGEKLTTSARAIKRRTYATV